MLHDEKILETYCDFGPGCIDNLVIAPTPANIIGDKRASTHSRVSECSYTACGEFCSINHQQDTGRICGKSRQKGSSKKSIGGKITK
jgi:hypothetical protein